jgi:hypothetical protein
VRPTDKKSSAEKARPNARHRRSRAGAIRTTSRCAARRSDWTHGESQCDRSTRSRAAGRHVRMHDISEVEPVQSGRRVVVSRDTVSGRASRASATDRREVERRDGASGCTVLTLFLVEHTNALDRTVIRNQLVETSSTGRSNCLGGRSNRLGQERRRKPRFAAPGGTPSGTVRLGLS